MKITAAALSHARRRMLKENVLEGDDGGSAVSSSSSSSPLWSSAAHSSPSLSLSVCLKVSLPHTLSFVAVIIAHAFTGGRGRPGGEGAG